MVRFLICLTGQPLLPLSISECLVLTTIYQRTLQKKMPFCDPSQKLIVHLLYRVCISYMCVPLHKAALLFQSQLSSWYLWKGQSWMSLSSRRGMVCGRGGIPMSLRKHNNNCSNTLLAALLMYFQAKTGIFASCVIYCGSHLHIKALISPSERVCVCVLPCLCEFWSWGCSIITKMCSQERGEMVWIRRQQSRAGDPTPARPGGPAGSDTEWDGALWRKTLNVSLSFVILL